MTSDLKLSSMLREKGIEDVEVRITEEPRFSVWRGCIVYGYAVPIDYEWNWNRMEGWLYLA